MNKIDYLIVSSTIDFSTDLVCFRLASLGKRFYRINRDEFKKHSIVVDLENQVMNMSIEGDTYSADIKKLKGIYFRAPVFLRTQSKKILSVEEQLERNQWSSFLRNLVIFQNAIWINNPVNTYRAENKMLQLCVAKECGLDVPKTYVSNAPDNTIKDTELYIVKSLDAALFYDLENNTEMFSYSNVLSGAELKEFDLHTAPVFVQEFLNPKVDYRVTYIMGKCYPVKIVKDGTGIYGDWRFLKQKLEYIPTKIPVGTERAIRKMMDMLGLNFGGIDLVYANHNYYFIEVNPTGEWGWLEANTDLEISLEIAKAMCQGENNA